MKKQPLETPIDWHECIDAIPDFVSVHDKTYTIIRANKVLADYLGMPLNALIGQFCYDVLCKRHKPCQCTFTKALSGKKSITEEAENTCMAASLLVTASPLYDEKMAVKAVVQYAKDISHLKRNQHEHFVTDKLNSIGVLASGIAHNYNNLLTAVISNISFAKILATKILTAKIPGTVELISALEQAENASRRTTNLTRQLLAFSQTGNPAKHRIKLKTLLKDMVSFSLSGTKVKHTYLIAPHLWSVAFNQEQISQVITNLLLNAIQAMPAGGKVWVYADNCRLPMKNAWSLAAGQYVKVSIQDKGGGIAPEIQDQVFDPYFTTKNISIQKRTHAGLPLRVPIIKKHSGLGLSVCFSIMKQHRGAIGFESKQDEGTTFFFFLPAGEEQIEIKKSIPVISPQVETSPQQYSTEKLCRGRILIMDDEKIILEVVNLILTHVGYEVEMVYNGQEAISTYQTALASDKPFDIVIMDLTVPGGMGGEEAIKEILKQDPEVKAILSSGFANDPVMSNYHKYGFTQRITKPYRPVELIDVVDAVLSKQGDKKQ